MKLTASTINSLSLPAGATEKIFFDSDLPGFGLRIRDGGSRTFIFQYKLGSKQRRVVIDRTTAISVGKARDAAELLRARVKLGGDPAGDRAEAVKTADETFNVIVPRYLKHQLAPKPQGGGLRPSSYAGVKHHLEEHAKVLHRLQLAKIQKRDIASCISAVRENSGGVTGNRVRTSRSGFFGWAVSVGLLDTNPVVGTEPTEEAPRDRFLKPEELKLIWNALGDDHYGSIVKILALTGQRADEIAGLRWSEIGEDEIMFPPARTKNHRQHSVPLTAPVRSILAAQPKRTNASGKPRDFVFGYREGAFSGWSKSKINLDTRIAEMNGGPVAPWRIHDLRRSFSTHAHGIGVQPHVIEAILNHISGHKAGVAGRYNQADYKPEKRAGLERWADQLLAWVEGRESNVTPLRA
jgi:integrase